jgi:hypothetical protein
MLDTPVLFLVFNRPETTQQVFNVIRQAQPKQLFVAADGPRPGKEGEKERCDKTRKLILEAIDWPCELKTLFREHNLGCGLAVSSAITWFFQNVEEGIILEDDTLPDLSFFNFCTALLEKYRHNDAVKFISGNNFQQGKWRGDGSYYFSAYSHIWGWASWRRVWKQYDYNLTKQDEASVIKSMDFYFTDPQIKKHWLSVFQKLKAGEINTWDIQLLFCIWEKKGITALPNVNLITNIGFGIGATHTGDTNDKLANIPYAGLKLENHPSTHSVDKEADTYTFFKIYRLKEKLLSRIVRKIIPKRISK